MYLILQHFDLVVLYKVFALGLFVGAEDGDNVQKIKFVLFSAYRYLIAFCDVLVRF